MFDADCDGCEQWPAPLVGYLPFGDPGVPLELYRGLVTLSRAGAPDLVEDGVVTLAWGRRARLLWSLNRAEQLEQDWSRWRHRGRDDAAQLGFVPFGEQLDRVPFGFTGHARGFLHGGDLGDPNVHLSRVIAHWVNVPRISRSGNVHAHAEDGTWMSWPARWGIVSAGWVITFDGRRDLDQVYDQAASEDSFVITHVMQISRENDEPFAAGDVEPVLDGLQFAMSFALGHWVCPAVPVGYDMYATPVWTQWLPWHCDRPKPMSGWWSRHQPDDLADFLHRFLAQWLDRDIRGYLRRATASAVLSVETGFVEQRLMTAISALEMLSWISEVHERGMDENKWRGKDTAWRVRRLLIGASADIYFRKDQVELGTFARDNGLGDGPATIAELRNRLVHPKIVADHYDSDGLLGRAAQQACRYLELALLCRIGYEGTTQDRTNVDRLAGDVDRVPWAVVHSEPSPIARPNGPSH